MSGAEGPEGLSQCQPALLGLHCLQNRIDAIPACSVEVGQGLHCQASALQSQLSIEFMADLVAHAVVTLTSQLSGPCMRLLKCAQFMQWPDCLLA